MFSGFPWNQNAMSGCHKGELGYVCLGERDITVMGSVKKQGVESRILAFVSGPGSIIPSSTGFKSV